MSTTSTPTKNATQNNACSDQKCNGDHKIVVSFLFSLI